jgi:hypothetical protein
MCLCVSLCAAKPWSVSEQHHPFGAPSNEAVGQYAEGRIATVEKALFLLTSAVKVSSIFDLAIICMHSNIWSTLYCTLAPSVVMFIIAIVFRVTKTRYAKSFFIVAAGLLLLPIILIVGHFTSLRSEMKKRAGTFVVVGQETINGGCTGAKFDSLRLKLEKNGKFTFSYKPCFTDRINGKWEWTDNMVHSYSRFDRLNDSLVLHFPSEFNVDTIVLTNYQTRFLVFAKSK